MAARLPSPTTASDTELVIGQRSPGIPGGEPWRLRAACRGLDRDELFFSDCDRWPSTARDRRAKKICFECPVRVECLEDALEYGDRYGIRGGLTANERQREIRRRRALR